MKLVSFGRAGNEKPGVLVDGGGVLDLRAADSRLPASTRDILAHDLLERVRQLAAEPPPKCVQSLDGIRLGPPVNNPSKIVCIGLNYKDHAEEQNRPLPEKPLLFAKAPSALSGAGDPIVLPAIEAKVDVEAELAFVVGRAARNVRANAWEQHIAGYMCFNDVSGRGAQYADGQWFRGKSYDTFAPCGPYLATRDEIADPHRLAIGSQVDDFVMQRSNTAELVFGVPQLLEYISASMTLEPGDIVATGTPAGVGVFRDPPIFLEANQQVAVSIEHLGTLVNPVHAENIRSDAPSR